MSAYFNVPKCVFTNDVYYLRICKIYTHSSACPSDVRKPISV